MLLTDVIVFDLGVSLCFGRSDCLRNKIIDNPWGDSRKPTRTGSELYVRLTFSASQDRLVPILQLSSLSRNTSSISNDSQSLEDTDVYSISSLGL